MRTDRIRLFRINHCMILNDWLYKVLQKEFIGNLEFALEYYPEDLVEGFDEYYLGRRILSVLRNHDLPFRSAIGILEAMNDDGEILSPMVTHASFMMDTDDDSSEELYMFLVDYGNENYETKFDATDADELFEERAEYYGIDLSLTCNEEGMEDEKEYDYEFYEDY